MCYTAASPPLHLTPALACPHQPPPQLKHRISALASKGDLTFAAVHGSIVECRRVHVTGEYLAHGGDILDLLVLGDRLLSLGRDGRLLVWRIGQYGAPEVELRLPPGFTPTCLAHPDTYLNKVVVGSAEGRLQLWNFATASLLFEFPGWGSAVCCIAPSPALDVVGVGLADG
jgi:U3 small nucleolar RNA-associated protein 21